MTAPDETRILDAVDIAWYGLTKGELLYEEDPTLRAVILYSYRFAEECATADGRGLATPELASIVAEAMVRLAFVPEPEE